MSSDPLGDRPEPVDLTTDDGYGLVGSLYQSARPRAALLINSAMGVRRGFYDDFARWLSDRGVTVLTYDYRGLGDSAPQLLRGFRADIQTWAAQDQRAAFEFLEREASALPVFVIGHSIGGQIVGLSPHNRRAAGIAFVASQSGYWGHYSGSTRYGAWLLWYVMIPVLTTFMGRFPAHWFKIGEPLPNGVARQWARWGRHPEYLRGGHPDTRLHHEDIRIPMRAWLVDDDSFAPPEAFRAMLSWYPDEQVEETFVRADDHGGRFGHWNWFRQRYGEPYWQQLLEWTGRIAERSADR